MKTLTCLALLALLPGCAVAPARTSATPVVATTTTSAVAPAALFTAEQLDVLLGPIALYPDPLIALILPASTNLSDVVLAARYLAAGGDPNQAEAQPWDDSVQALARYPEVLRWMDDNLAWTKQLGDAFANQPGDVMDAVQRLRRTAIATGSLISTPQQQVVYRGTLILILPVEPEVIYIPYYNPNAVYVRSYSESYYGFSLGFAAGWWLSYGLDWQDHCLWSVHHDYRERHWRDYHRDWNHHVRPPYGPPPPDIKPWRPRPDRRPPQITPSRPHDVVRPTPHRPDRDRPAPRPGPGSQPDRRAPSHPRAEPTTGPAHITPPVNTGAAGPNRNPDVSRQSPRENRRPDRQPNPAMNPAPRPTTPPPQTTAPAPTSPPRPMRNAVPTNHGNPGPRYERPAPAPRVDRPQPTPSSPPPQRAEPAPAPRMDHTPPPAPVQNRTEPPRADPQRNDSKQKDRD
ncbi:DUF3300 domain-containing protein [Opitutus sp. ER46]|uniref:DUF3300 domain-containing protein n=1 Tax=Opitutus sp. ER46 TaxID=2161864 RepID=UPI001304B7D3|nr:DUF3300 domain-containing protein [Opitutus sp. ER46]